MNLPTGKWLKNGNFKLTKTFIAHTDNGDYIAEKGFETDGASIPRFLWWISDPWSVDTLPGAIIHDKLYKIHYDRPLADATFLYIMKENKVKIWKRWSYYIAVRLFGWVAYSHERTI